MSRRLFRLLWVLAALVAPAAQAQDGSSRYWSDTWRGWHFYEDPEPEALPRREATPKSSASTPKPAASISRPGMLKTIMGPSSRGSGDDGRQ